MVGNRVHFDHGGFIENPLYFTNKKTLQNNNDNIEWAWYYQ